MAISTLQTVYTKDLQKKIYENGLDFLNYSVDHTQYLNGKTVTINNANLDVTTVKNPGLTNSTYTQRADSTLTYTVDYYSTKPTAVTFDDEHFTSYSMRQNTVEDHMESLRTVIKEGVLYAWASGTTASNNFQTTGASSSVTGKNIITKSDILNLAKAMDNDGISRDGRYLYLPTEFIYDLFTDTEILTFEAFNASSAMKPLQSAILTILYGFNIMSSPTCLHFDGNTLIDSPTGASVYNQGAIAWQSKMVATAKGAISAFIEEGSGNPQMHGASLFGAGVLLGARMLRGADLDFAGVYTLNEVAG